MPTGYTAEIFNGNTSAKDYILRCARAFGALGFMRDESWDAPIPEKVPEDTYPKECYEKARKRLEELKAMSEEDIHRENVHAYEEVKASWQRSWERNVAENARYDEVLEKVKAWDCSINPDLQELKNFALEQLQVSKDDPSWYQRHMNDIQPRSDEEWYREEMESCLRDISSYKIKIEKDEKWRAECNQWIADLKKSLEGLDA